MSIEITAEHEAAHDRLRALVHLDVSDVIFYLRVRGDEYRFDEVNAAFLATTGLREDQVIGKRVDDVIPQPSLALVRQKYAEAIREGKTVRWDEITDFPSGRRHGEVSVTPIVDKLGRCVSLIGTVRDVTEPRRLAGLLAAEQRALAMIAAGASLPDILDALVRDIEALLEPAIGSILLLTADGLRLRHGAAPNLPEEYNRAIDGALIGPAEGSCGTAATRRELVVVTDIATDPLWTSYSHLAARFGLRACWSAPILSAGGRVLGTFALYYREPRAPSDAERDLIARVSHVAGIAIERHELDEQLRELAARIDAAREDERTNIAREIHDQLGQSLTLLKVDLAWIARRAAADTLPREVLLEKLSGIGEVADELIREVRRIATALRPPILDDVGLDAALAWQAEEFERRTKIPCKVQSGLADDARISRPVATTVFRVFQEALTNVIRHAHATRVDVRCEETSTGLLLMVCDDGVGIAPEKILDPRSLGLLGMRERARRLGGTVTIERRRPRGTAVTLELPHQT
ncbi:MAG: GAF domain-containing protein [Deltaproteobacteria bacterium]|nr:GAF domain-containing protein [Kofleriaceae bacterium]